MGVHGLTTYLREHRNILSQTIHLPSAHPTNAQSTTDGAERISVVLDGWSFIYEVVFCGDLPWVYGGEYPQLSQLVRQVVNAWVETGLDLHFVFDGPYPTLKFPTLVSRITQNHVQNGLLFFRTSSMARSTPRFLHETAMLPPFSYNVCVDTLVDLAAGVHKGKLHVHIADEEGDPYAVALAGRLNAYVAGRDSDFVVFNAEGYKGYIPLDEMVWTFTQPSSMPWDGEGSVYSVDTEADFDENGFQPARTSKSRKKRTAAAQQHAGRGIVPPAEAFGAGYTATPGAQLSLSFTAYSPTTLAAHLEIPASLLPLLGALVGNDYTGAADDSAPGPATAAQIRTRRQANLQRLFFERQLTLGQRIARVAQTLAGVLAAAFGQGAAVHRKRGRKPIGSVMELIDAAVTALLIRPLDTFATGEREAIVERVVEATLQYAIPKPPEELWEGEEPGKPLRWVSDVCPLHVAEACPLWQSLSRLIPVPEEDSLDGFEDGSQAKSTTEGPHEIVRGEYCAAYRRGHFDPHILDSAQSATSWPRMFLENPDKECVARSVGRPIREWTYAILDASIGLPSPPEPELATGEDEDDDEDELIDVVEEDDSDEDDGGDPLARLRGALKDLGDSDDEDRESGEEVVLPSALAEPRGKPKVITEYVRRGTRLADEEVQVTFLPELLRGIDLESPRTGLPLPPPLWPEDARRRLLRTVLGSDYPAVEALPDGRVLAVLAVRFVARQMHLRALESPGVKERQLGRWTQAEAKAFLTSTTRDSAAATDLDAIAVPIVERNVQLVAQVSAALDAIEQLAHVLLLSPALESPAKYFSGKRFHAILSGALTPPSEGEVSEEWEACVAGLEDAYTALPSRKGKKERRAQKSGDASAGASAGRGQGKGQKAAVSKGGLFALLADAEA
ncbi:hypothetical protein BD413DRAFT_487111 [Trametes elegans]|nr:hypothetical protein BD413DRAFT_487111 [Trametes elegans]